MTVSGLWAIVRAIDTFCFIPVESFSTRTPAYSVIPNLTISASTRSCTLFSGYWFMRAKNSMVSRAVSLG